MGYWGYNDVREVDLPTGAALMVRQKVISQVGLLDEQFYMYYEDVDWCFRIKKRGWRIYFFPLAEIVHYGRQSAKSAMSRMVIQGYKSRHKFFRKHYGILSEWIVKQMDLFGLLLKTLYRTATLCINSMSGSNRVTEYPQRDKQILKDYCAVIKRFWEISV